MKVTETVKSVTKPAAKFGAGTAGLIGGSLVASKIPELTFLMNIPVVGQYLSKIAPGAVVMVLAFLLNKKFENELVKAGAFGMGLAGFANAVKRLTNGTPLQMISDAVPAGLGIVKLPTNYGDYPPALQASTLRGLKGAGQAYNLSGGESKAYNLTGVKGLGEAGKAYLLSGQ